MKKVSKLVLLPLLCLSFASLSACSKDDEKIRPTYGEVTHQKYHQISYSRLNSMIDAKESFLLVVDPVGCGCFNYFMKASEDYIKNHHLVLYYMKVSDFNGNDNKGIKIVEGNTSFAIFNKGEIQQSIVSNSSTDIMEKKDEFEEYIDKYIVSPRMYLVKQDDLDKMYHNSNKSVIYFARNKCGDCSAINKDFLYNYMENHDQILYVCDGDDIGIREYDGDGHLTPESSVKWQEFKDKYGLSTVNNETYGYDMIDGTKGVVPTFLLVSGTQDTTTYHSGAVAFNDIVQKESDTYKLTDTYYTAERQPYLAYNTYAALKGRTIPKNQVYFFDEEETIGTWNKSGSQNEYFNRVCSFLDNYLSQATYRF